MKKNLLLILALVGFVFSSIAQPYLKPSIGISNPPKKTDSLCKPITYIDNSAFENSGYQIGDTVNDFTLYNTKNQPINLRNELRKGKPVLLLGASYTCPVYRDKLVELNDLYNKYSQKVSIFIIYTVEAHPRIDASPYSGKENITKQNQQDNILYRQPKTYEQRRGILETMTDSMLTLPEILVDGLCNEWWLNFGPAPNNAYLIDSHGIVFEKHGWFNRAPYNMEKSIERYFGAAPEDTTGIGQGDISFRLLAGNSVVGKSNEYSLDVYGMLKNNSTTAPINVKFSRDSKNMPMGWTCAFCLDVCYSDFDSIVTQYVNPGDSQLFIFHFYPNGIADSGSATFYLEQIGKATDIQEYTVLAKADYTSGINTVNNTTFSNQVLYTDNGQVRLIYTNEIPDRVDIYSLGGKILVSKNVSSSVVDIDVNNLPAGLYLIHSYSKSKVGSVQKLIVR